MLSALCAQKYLLTPMRFYFILVTTIFLCLCLYHIVGWSLYGSCNFIFHCVCPPPMKELVGSHIYHFLQSLYPIKDIQSSTFQGDGIKDILIRWMCIRWGASCLNVVHVKPRLLLVSINHPTFNFVDFDFH